MTQDKRVQRTYNALEKALLTLLKKKSVGQITTSELCREAGINRNTFYAHFSTPNDVFGYVVSKIATELSENFLAAMKSKDPASPLSFNYEDYLVRLCVGLKENRETVETLVSSKTGMDYIVDVWKSFQEQQIAVWQANNNNHLNHDDLLLLNKYAMHGVADTILDWILDGFVVPPELLGRKLAALVEITLVSAIGKEDL